MTTAARALNGLLLSGPECCSVAACGSAITAWSCLASGVACLDVVPFAFALSYFCILTIAFKAHLFVANALLLWVSPAFLVRRVRVRWRVVWLAFATASIVAVATFAQGRAGLPDLKLDGSAM